MGWLRSSSVWASLSLGTETQTIRAIWARAGAASCASSFHSGETWRLTTDYRLLTTEYGRSRAGRSRQKRGNRGRAGRCGDVGELIGFRAVWASRACLRNVRKAFFRMSGSHDLASHRACNLGNRSSTFRRPHSPATQAVRHRGHDLRSARAGTTVLAAPRRRRRPRR
jgi:hypothetical protein